MQTILHSLILSYRQEFAEHGLLDTIELEHRNVCKDGFGSAEDADAVFLDLPAPWEAIEDAKRVMAVSQLVEHNFIS